MLESALHRYTAAKLLQRAAVVLPVLQASTVWYQELTE
jgi:hypothetical protein